MVMINLAASVATVGVEVDAIADAKREVIVTERLAMKQPMCCSAANFRS